MDIRNLKNAAVRREAPLPIHAAGSGEASTPAICSCDHPTMDPTPREWTKKQRAPVKRVGIIAAGLERARKGTEQRKKGAVSFSQVKAQHKSEHEALSVAISGLGHADGVPTHSAALDLSEEELLPPSSTTSAAMHKDETFSASRLAQLARDAERNRGKVGFSAYDLQIRHRELMQRRAAAGEPGAEEPVAPPKTLKAAAVEDGDVPEAPPPRKPKKKAVPPPP